MNEERPIEKLLRRYAKKRRDEGGPARELHSATRRMLQSEVERQFPKPASKEHSAFDEFVAVFARRWIYAAGVFVVLLVAAAVMLPSLSKAKNKTKLAQSAPVSRADALAAPELAASAPASVNSAGSLADNRSEGLTRRKIGSDRDGSNDGNLNSDLIAPSVATLAESAVASSAVAKREADSFQDKAQIARSNAPQEKDAQNYFRQSFANDQGTATKIAAVSGGAKAVTPVLANFQIEQSGNKLRVIDGDGSTYHGEVAPDQSYSLTQITPFKSEGKERLAGETREQQQKPLDGAYQFRVEGTNRTLNQQVVFAWNCVPITNALAFSNNSFAASELKKVDASKFPQQFPGLQNSTINGRAQIASEKEIEINARPVSP